MSHQAVVVSRTVPGDVRLTESRSGSLRLHLRKHPRMASTGRERSDALEDSRLSGCIERTARSSGQLRGVVHDPLLRTAPGNKEHT
jgi:hypothetical protein